MRVAVILMNLGGPDSLKAVRPFLFNLFSDPAILRLPTVLRLPLARLIAWRRAMVAREIYRRLGGGSPLLANTRAQAQALEAALGSEHRCFVAMRYWHPTSEETAREVRDWAPDEIVCLPLYPQFSTTTTASSLAAWDAAARRHGIERRARVICCYPSDRGLAEALAGLIRPFLEAAKTNGGPMRLLLTAHGLPKRIADADEPYPGQVEETAAAVIAALNRPEVDWQVCYQSRVGPLEWIGPAIDDEIRRAGQDGVSVVVAPISFVSEHSETLVELDHDYRLLAKVSGVPTYYRVPTLGVEPAFIQLLAQLVRRACAGDWVGSCAAGRPGCRALEATV
jgi:protoporphyrin/coproporphyrin ferrochelatase